jgi:hypothetical protein
MDDQDGHGPSSSSSAASNLTNLTVPQLKVLCKERRITGYSKLPKSAIIQKLTDDINSSVHSSTATARVLPTDAAPSTARSSSTQGTQIISHHALPSEILVPTRLQEPLTDKSTPLPAPKIAKKHHVSKNLKSKTKCTDMPPPVAPVSSKGLVDNNMRSTGPPAHSSMVNSAVPLDTVTMTTKLFKGSKRSFLALNESMTTELSFKKKNIPTRNSDHSDAVLPEAHIFTQSISTTTNANSLIGLPKAPNSELQPSMFNVRSDPKCSSQSTISSSSLKTDHHPHITPGPAPKRFRPLVTKKQITPSGSYLIAVSSATTAFSRSGNTTSGRYLDFTPTPASPSPRPIKLPPSLLQRKHVHQWSILLSGITNSDRRACVLVSRMFRYSGASLASDILIRVVFTRCPTVYLSAGYILTQRFSGHRLTRLIQDYPLNRTNMWPYLRLRQVEFISRTQAYQNSFLGKYLKNHNSISERLWTSPDNERQVVVALRWVKERLLVGFHIPSGSASRFVLTRLWFLVSIGGDRKDPLAWSRGVVADCQEIIAGEIWSVTVHFCSHTETFHVLEQTCEVVGHPTASSHPATLDFSSSAGSKLHLRSDWAAYIAHRVLPPSMHNSPPTPLLDHLRWSNYEEYDKGISKVWLNRVDHEGETGKEKREMAERYVLACVAGNR